METIINNASSHVNLFKTGKGQAFALSVMDSALSLLPMMNQSTLHYALELVSIAVKQFLDPSISSNASAVVSAALITSAARIVQVSANNFLLSTLKLMFVWTGDHIMC
jgi:hypothetical protein